MLKRVIGYVGAAVLVVVGVLASVKGYVPVPGTAPVSAPTSSPAVLSSHAKILLQYNNQQSYWVGGVTQWTLPAKGVVAHKINATQAEEEADQLDATITPSAPLSIPYALLSSESVMDPMCQNGNFAGSNPTKDPLGYDDGVAQIKLRYLVGSHGVTDAASAQAFAFDVHRAIPYFWGVFNSHLAVADKLISGNSNSAIDPRLMNRWALAALLYKQGDTGGTAIFKTGVWPSELNNFVSLEQYFAKQLGQKSVFAQ